ncbi:MAG: hypothetical protein ACI9UA_004570 [Pseudoalteromonas tetraodonis]|jgi:hypothetical protein
MNQPKAKDVSDAAANGSPINPEDAEMALEAVLVRKPLLTAWKPSEFRNFDPPPDFMLCGDCHFTRGNITVIAGAPGVGKSRAAMALAIAGATGKPWMGFDVHSKFKTLVIQVENGEFRMKGEFTDIGEPAGVDLDDWVRVTPPPPFGMDFLDTEFQDDVRALIADFQPGVIVIDPWNRVAGDDNVRSYKAAIEAIMACLPPASEQRPAIAIIHHLRKRGAISQKKHGRDLLAELAGSYSIGSVARSVFAIEPATPDPEDDRVVVTCCKNNDGREGEATAWHRRNGLFASCADFDWDEFYADESSGPKGSITADQVKDAIGSGGVTKSAAAKSLESATGKSRSSCFAALSRFNEAAIDSTGKLYWRDADGS